MLILKKPEVSPLITQMAQKESTSAHKSSKALGNLCFPYTGAHRDLQTSYYNPREMSLQVQTKGHFVISKHESAKRTPERENPDSQRQLHSEKERHEQLRAEENLSPLHRTPSHTTSSLKQN